MKLRIPDNLVKMSCSISIVLVVQGCSGFKPFQPNPDLYKNWKKNGASDDEVKRAMLECGFPAVYDWPKVSIDRNEIILMYRCMTADGFIFQVSRGYCEGWDVNSIPSACVSGEPAPKRSVKKRLDGEFCRSYPSAKICGP